MSYSLTTLGSSAMAAMIQASGQYEEPVQDSSPTKTNQAPSFVARRVLISFASRAVDKKEEMKRLSRAKNIPLLHDAKWLPKKQRTWTKRDRDYAAYAKNQENIALIESTTPSTNGSKSAETPRATTTAAPGATPRAAPHATKTSEGKTNGSS